ncbi:MAG: hypothetical protein II956_03135 [Bacteroidales bacterium]|nr:hypothetical protein [Bacteroidales bacterium]
MAEKTEIKQQKKSYFQKKEGKTAGVFIGASVAAVAIFHRPIIDFFTKIWQDMQTSLSDTVIGFGVLGLLVFIATDKRARKLVSYGFKSLMRWITSWFTELDPIKILESYVEELDKNFKLLGDNIAKLRSNIAKLRDTINTNNREITKSVKLIEEAKRQNRQEVIAVNSNQIGRLKALNQKYGAMVGKMEDLNNVLIKMHSYSSYKLTDTKNEIRMKKQEFSAISSGYSAMRNAQNILEGDYARNERYEAATEALAQDLSVKIAEMDNFMELSSSIFEEMDLQNSIYQAEGMKMFDEITSKGQAILDKLDTQSENDSYFIKKKNL